MTPFYQRGGITIYCGDNRDILPDLDAESIHACVTDPPYGLSFMGKGWDHGVPGVEFWTNVLRVLKPGGHLLAFGGTRTYHRLAVAIEDAGFEVRDCIMWVYGSGFPKSLDVGKAIDKAAGAEHLREFSHKNPADRPYTHAVGKTSTGWQSPVRPDKTLPATDAAKQWSGWGTALKPAFEPIIVARKPLQGTVAANVLKWGTGGINVGACRIATEDSLSGGAYSGGERPSQFLNGGLYRKQPDDFKQPSGRWPANVVFSHHPGCVCTGTKRVKGHAGYPNGPGGKSMHYSDAEGRGIDVRPDAWAGHADADGLETVSSYICVAGCPCGHSWNTPDLTACPECGCRKTFWCCPVRELDEQSGESGSGSGQVKVSAGTKRGSGSWDQTGGMHKEGQVNIGVRDYGDSAGASRFFQTFPPFQYVAKADGSERRQSKHPTVKPLDLMRYLVRLVCPIGGTVFEPFMGSGSTIEAAREEHCKAIGIELSADYCADAVARLRQGVLNFGE